MNYHKHKVKWNGCELCTLSNCRHRMVFGRGKLPSKILFVGEAPGDSEDVIGKPFVGPAGRLLNKTIATTLGEDLPVSFTNLVSCIPKEHGEKREPSKEEIQTCAPRLVEFYNLAKPEYVVTVGTLSDKWVPKILGHDESKTISIYHPAYILRLPITQRGLAQQRNESILLDLAEAIYETQV